MPCKENNPPPGPVVGQKRPRTTSMTQPSKSSTAAQKRAAKLAAMQEAAARETDLQNLQVKLDTANARIDDLLNQNRDLKKYKVAFAKQRVAGVGADGTTPTADISCPAGERGRAWHLIDAMGLTKHYPAYQEIL
ncbi:hypothetical protein FRB99_003485, partial [Tulasnella sp. 403]